MIQQNFSQKQMSQMIIQIFLQCFIRLSARRQLRVVFEIFGLSKSENKKAIFAEHIGKFFFFYFMSYFLGYCRADKAEKKNNVTIQIHHLARPSHSLYIRPTESHKLLDVVNQMNLESFNSNEQTEPTFVWFSPH